MASGPVLAQELVAQWPSRLDQPAFARTGGVHATGLFTADGELLFSREDVGRHNAVDSIAGWMWLEGIDGADKNFYTTGRLTSEMVIKAAQMDVPRLASRSGLTKAGHVGASQVGATATGAAVEKH